MEQPSRQSQIPNVTLPNWIVRRAASTLPPSGPILANVKFDAYPYTLVTSHEGPLVPESPSDIYTETFYAWNSQAMVLVYCQVPTHRIPPNSGHPWKGETNVQFNDDAWVLMLPHTFDAQTLQRPNICQQADRIRDMCHPLHDVVAKH